MGEQNPFQTRSPAKEFAISLATSTLDSFHKDFERRRDEDAQTKKTDYDLLMSALKQIQNDPDLTPTEMRQQTAEIMTRAVDIMKPKGHQDIKGRLKEMFGGGQPYQMQAGKIYSEATRPKPRLNINNPLGAGTRVDPVLGSTQVIMPSSPEATHPERTYREQEVFDKEKFARMQADAMAKRQLDDDERTFKARQADIALRNKLTTERYATTLSARLRGQAFAALKAEAAKWGDPDDPAVLERARLILQERDEAKLAETRARAQLIGIRAKNEDERFEAWLANVQSTIDTRASQQGLSYFKAKLDPLKVQLKTAQDNLDALYAQEKGDTWLLMSPENKATHNMKVMMAKQELNLLTNEVLQYATEAAEQQANQVTLPSAPSRGSSRRGTTKLTEAEIRAAGGTDADVAEARRRGVLAQ